MKLCEARKKIFGRGGPSYPWGGTENFLDGGGTGLDEGGGQPFHRVWPPHPSHVRHPWASTQDNENIRFKHQRLVLG